MSNLRLSKKDIRFLDVVYKCGSILAVSPNYNFKKNIIIEIIQVLQSLELTMIIVNKNFTLKEDELSQNLALSNFMVCVYIAISMAFVVMSCDSTTSQSNNVVKLCYKMQEHFLDDSNERRKLIWLAKQTSTNGARFTAANLFEINRKIFIGILSITTTYFIIIIQFSA
ncbi:hypothetical protein BDFB_013469 [Asbolus verrucosus]|uniref:7tm 7 domain containing protein n=1 Tax=Asbolus verrucosus TaxID=1661398 RepID=A0A482WE31_ASBVE|nr:hypothetical protein BDFB_013469 [Asbolus verrucosus]